MGSLFLCLTTSQHDLCHKHAILVDKCTRAAISFGDAADGLYAHATDLAFRGLKHAVFLMNFAVEGVAVQAILC